MLARCIKLLLNQLFQSRHKVPAEYQFIALDNQLEAYNFKIFLDELSSTDYLNCTFIHCNYKDVVMQM